ncbi:MAG: 1-acyl-sn-glycerol-3-phosphate acyltransferase [Clostridia bacterium]|nr:1-acyl-sn-glycerol-3-phosphate acyltransferase [Clostridia bacterium]
MKGKKKSTWTKRRHARIFAFLRPIMRFYFRLRYNYRANPSGLKKGAYLIISNHQTTMDPFMLSLSFKFPVYFIASDDIFNLKISPLIKYLVAPIPKSKSLRDVAAMMGVFRVIKEGGAVGIFPEGNRTVSGKQWEMTDAIAKLAKSLKVPLVIYNIKGGYGTDPRWGHSIRKGRSEGCVRRIISPEELKDKTTEELFNIIKDELSVDDTLSGIEYRSRKRAEFIERALYLCPICNGVSGIVSDRYRFKCRHCNTVSTYTEKLLISPLVNGYTRIYEWFEWERAEIVKKVADGFEVGDDGIIFRESVKFSKKKKLAGNRVLINKENLIISDKKQKSVYPIKDITALTMVGKKKFNFYYDGKILQVKGNKRFCAIKYVHIFDGLRQINGGDAKEDLK